jgi:leader peptidase (prepilin peptidase)/N-methyltransferase
MLSGVLGMLLGWPGIAAGLVYTIFLGGIGSLVVILYLVLRKKFKAFTAIPYGPFLLLAAALLILRS